MGNLKTNLNLTGGIGCLVRGGRHVRLAKVFNVLIGTKEIKKKHVRKVRERRDKVVEESKQFVWNYLLAHPCVDCGESDPIVLEFDHVRGKKRKIISQLVNSGYGIDVIKKEIAKCEVRCSNCHKRKTAREQGWFRG